MNYQNFASDVKIVEVGPRDGLQNEKKIIATEDKLTYIDKLIQSGLKCIETTSFVRAPRIPQMADASELYEALTKKNYSPDIDLPCLVPNLKGLENALNVGVKSIALFSATSETFTKKNINATIEESFDRFEELMSQVDTKKIRVRGYISTVFGCPYEGEIDHKKVVYTVERFNNLGVHEISLGDTTGVATPKQVSQILDKLKDHKNLAMHFHDTRGMALSNILVSLEKGISVFDASSGGLGGCPYAKGASGNVATEDVLYLMESLGIQTGVDLKKVFHASKFILEKVGKQSPSKYFQALLNKDESCH